VIDVATHGMTSQKKSSYGHSSIYSSSPFFLLGAHLRVASTYYFNPVSDELVGLITYYLVIVLIYCVIIIIFLLKIFIAENEKAFRPRTETYIHTYLYL